jgi:hypothetical protein
MPKPLSLSDRQLHLVQQTIKNVPPRHREEFMAKLGAMLAPSRVASVGQDPNSAAPVAHLSYLHFRDRKRDDRGTREYVGVPLLPVTSDLKLFPTWCDTGSCRIRSTTAPSGPHGG